MHRISASGKIRQLVLLSSMVLFMSHAAQAGGTLNQLKARFNHDRNVPRLILLVSPTCPECVGGAEWIQQEILDKYPALNIRVYAVWYEMLPGDSKAAYPSARKLMPDRRVAHYWDKEKATGKWFKTAVPNSYEKPVMWDAYYLYDADAQWDQAPGPLVSWGRTLLDTRQELLKQVSLIAEKYNGASSR